jgi:hypothetical protein
MSISQDSAAAWLASPIQNVTRLLGPIGLTRMHFSGNADCPSKVFYLFQDVHKRNPVTCESVDRMHIQDFMEHVIEDSSYAIDFILETYDNDGSHTEKTCYILELRAKFDACFNRSLRSGCQWSDPSKRFHFNDVRYNYDFTLQKSSMKAHFEGVFVVKDGVFPDLDAAYCGLKSLVKTPQEWKDALMVAYKVNRQLSFCTGKVSTIIREWVDARISAAEGDLEVSLKRFHDFMQRLKDAAAVQKTTGKITHEQLFRVCEGYARSWQKIFSLQMVLGESQLLLTPVIMDAYTVARMFRTFSSKHHTEVYDAPMQNIFVYTGAKHSDNYVELLTALGCTVEVEVASNRAEDPHGWNSHKLNQCIDVTAFKPWPLVNTKTKPTQAPTPTFSACVAPKDPASMETDWALFVEMYSAL